LPNPVTKQHESKREVSHKQCSCVEKSCLYKGNKQLFLIFQIVMKWYYLRLGTWQIWSFSDFIINTSRHWHQLKNQKLLHPKLNQRKKPARSISCIVKIIIIFL